MLWCEILEATKPGTLLPLAASPDPVCEKWRTGSETAGSRAAAEENVRTTHPAKRGRKKKNTQQCKSWENSANCSKQQPARFFLSLSQFMLLMHNIPYHGERHCNPQGGLLTEWPRHSCWWCSPRICFLRRSCCRRWCRFCNRNTHTFRKHNERTISFHHQKKIIILLSYRKASHIIALLGLTEKAVKVGTSSLCSFGSLFSFSAGTLAGIFLKNNVWGSKHLLYYVGWVMMASKSSQNFGQQLLWGGKWGEEQVCILPLWKDDVWRGLRIYI